MVPSKSAPLPPAVPPKPSTNPFLARRGSEEGHRPSALGERERPPNPNARARSEGRTPPLPPRKPSVPVVPSLPPRHSSLAKMPETIAPGTSAAHPNVLIQQSLQATRVAQSLKKAEQRLEQERVWEVLKSSNPSAPGVHNLRRTRSISPTKDPAAQSTSGSSGSGRRERLRDRPAPTLPPRRKMSPPASTFSGSTTRSFESVARASIPHSLSRARGVISPSASASTSPTRTPPRPLSDLPAEPPPTHPDRKPTLPGVDGERSGPSSPATTGEFPRVYRSKSMNHPSPPPLPPLRRKRPESVQLPPISSGSPSPVDSPFMSPSRPSFPSSGTGAGMHGLSRHQSLSGRPRPGEALQEPIANLQRTLTSLGQKAAPRLDSARYKAEAAFNPRGFVQHSHARPGLSGLGARWGVQEGEERLIDSDDEAVGDGESSVGQDITGDSAKSPGGEEPEWSQRLRRLKMGEAENDGGRESPSRRSFGVERDEMKWPTGEGWKRL